uniref:Uncharacterized protein n=1 Tax=Rhizophora mucronata TaxID=61149 RepID=A0A2P2PYB1_RHIMU
MDLFYPQNLMGSFWHPQQI